jgi:predicted DNA-binding protein with PD1-like motif
MDIEVGVDSTLVHLNPGEVLHDAVCQAFEASNRRFAIVASCIGSLRYVDYGLAACDEQGIVGPGLRFTRSNDAIEVGGIQGHIGVDVDNQPSPHLHGVMFGREGECFGGHLFEAHVLITLEFALIGGNGPGWKRVHEPVLGSPPLPLLKPTAQAIRDE